MAELELKLLGDLEVIREGAVLPLPPSKKTRALLAYLALNDRSFRREHLCELLWEIPDDPRGSLRWSLSKLRRVVDDEAKARIVANRTSVRMDASDLVIDLNDLKAIVSGDLAATPVERLESAADRYLGNFLEGLELSNFHDFHAWCIAEREGATRAQAQLLTHLRERLSDEPDRAIRHARSLVGISPYDEDARAKLVGLLVKLHRTDEAEQQVRLGERMLEEIGAQSSGALLRALRGRPRQPSSSPTESPAAVVVETAPVMPESHVLIGRDSECGWIRKRFGGISGGDGRVVLLAGEPGIGKSRLLEWFCELAESAGALVLRSSAFESAVIRPYGLWIDSLRRAGDDALIFGEEDRDNRDRLFGGLSDYLAGRAAEAPVVVLFDDVQWADESSMAALHYVARACAGLPLLVVLAGRDGEMQDNAALQQTLRGLRHENALEERIVGPLSEDAIRDLISDRAPDADGGALGRECGGNPLLAIELARAKREGDQGGSLDELVRERLARFDVDGGEVMRWAAVLSPSIDLPSLVRVTGLDANRVGSALEMAERQAMLRAEDKGFRFSHDLIARGVYAQIAPARRAVMHRRVAELIEEEAALDLEHAADLAHHALASGDPGLGARAMVSAGKLCLRFFANDEALVLARKGLQIAAQLSDAEHVCRRLELFDVMLTAAPVYDWEAAAEEYAALAERALDHGALAHARLGYQMASYVRWVHGHWSGAQQETMQAEMVTRGASEEEHVIGMAETARCLAMLERDLSRAEAMLMEASALAERQRFSYYAIPAAQGMLRYHEDDLDEAERLFVEARVLCKSAGDRVSEFQANEYLVMIDLERGRFEEALRRCRALIEIGSKLREGSEAPFAMALDGLCRYAIGESDEALDEALGVLRLADAKHRLAYVQNRAARIDLDGGHADRAIERCREALEDASLLERNTEMLLARIGLARGTALAGDAAASAEHRQAVQALMKTPAATWALRSAEQLLGSE
jgi:DNA-binding SARP family transcriptional activator/tetratricopeptide (TPR) repeat protein